MSLFVVFAQGGILMFPLVFILCVILGIACVGAWRLLVPTRNRLAGVQTSLDRLLVWGGFAVVIGFLGSAVGYYKAMSAVMKRGVVNPRLVWIGTAEGMVSTLAGLVVLIIAGILWFALRARYHRVRRPGIEQP
jgi:hypothetical protein